MEGGLFRRYQNVRGVPHFEAKCRSAQPHDVSGGEVRVSNPNGAHPCAVARAEIDEADTAVIGLERCVPARDGAVGDAYIAYLALAYEYTPQGHVFDREPPARFRSTSTNVSAQPATEAAGKTAARSWPQCRSLPSRMSPLTPTSTPRGPGRPRPGMPAGRSTVTLDRACSVCAELAAVALQQITLGSPRNSTCARRSPGRHRKSNRCTKRRLNRQEAGSPATGGLRRYLHLRHDAAAHLRQRAGEAASQAICATVLVDPSREGPESPASAPHPPSQR